MRSWSDEEKQITSKLLQEELTYGEISDRLVTKGYYRSSEAVRKFVSRNKNKESEIYSLELPAGMDDIPDKFKDALIKISSLRDQLVNVTTKRFVNIGRPVNPVKKILTLSDLHIPFENTEVIQHALDHHSDADVLVLNGDIFEVYAASKWPKHKAILLKWEYDLAVMWLKLFSETFPRVQLVSGNHEHRLQSYFSANVDPAVSFMVDDDILHRLSQGYVINEFGEFEKKYNFKNVFYDGQPLRWYTKIGKCIFAHPLSFSSVPMRTVINTANAFLNSEEFQALVIGHSHKIGSLIWRDKLLVEQGCCCVPLDYESDGRLKYLPQAFGYAVVYMDKQGNVDFNKTSPVYLGTGTAIKADQISIL